MGRASVFRVVTCLLLLPAVTGCSFIFVTTPPAPPEGQRERAGDCTSSKVAPGFDTVFGGLEVVRTMLAATAADSVYSDPDQPLSREADIGLGIGFTALFVTSAVYGFVNTSHCSELRRHETYGDDADGDSAPTRSSHHAPPAARTTIKHPGADEPAPEPAAEEPAASPAPAAPPAPGVAPGTEDSAKGEDKPTGPSELP